MRWSKLKRQSLDSFGREGPAHFYSRNVDSVTRTTEDAAERVARITDLNMTSAGPSDLAGVLRSCLDEKVRFAFIDDFHGEADTL